MSNIHEQIPQLSEESLTRMKEHFVKMRNEIDKNSERELKLEIPEKYLQIYDFEDLENEIPTLRWCPFCRCETTTEIFYENTPMTFWSSVAIFFSGGVFGCCLLPYMVDSCKDSRARCHRCKHKVNTHM